MEFSIKLKELREREHLSQAELAKILGVGISTVGMWESTQRTPSAKTIQKLVRLFNCPLEELLGGESVPNHFNGTPAASTTLPSDERELLGLYRAMRPDVRESFWIVARKMAAPDTATSKKKA